MALTISARSRNDSGRRRRIVTIHGDLSLLLLMRRDVRPRHTKVHSRFSNALDSRSHEKPQLDSHR